MPAADRIDGVAHVLTGFRRAPDLGLEPRRLPAAFSARVFQTSGAQRACLAVLVCRMEQWVALAAGRAVPGAIAADRLAHRTAAGVVVIEALWVSFRQPLPRMPHSTIGVFFCDETNIDASEVATTSCSSPGLVKR